MRDYLKVLRSSLGMSQQSVAKKLYVTRQYYQQIETGDRQMHMGMNLAIKLSEIFEVPLNYIIDQESQIQSDVERKSS